MTLPSIKQYFLLKEGEKQGKKVEGEEEEEEKEKEKFIEWVVVEGRDVEDTSAMGLNI